MIHNASIEKYRTPVGAVTCGSEMTIRLYETGKSVSKAEIIMYSETFHREYEMKRKKDCMEEHLKITNEAGIVWYYFRIWEHGRCYFYGAKHGQTQGEGMIYDDTPQSFQITVERAAGRICHNIKDGSERKIPHKACDSSPVLCSWNAMYLLWR